MTKPFYITTPIYYVNAEPHIGTAYTTLVCDVVARFKRLEGQEVKFLTGTDEHGQKIARSAEKAGISPQEFVDQMAEKFEALFNRMNISNDDFIRTTSARHKEAAITFWNKLVESGDIYLGEYAGWYSVRDEAFFGEDELINGKAPTGADVEWVKEESYFFKLSKWQEPLLRFYETHPEFVSPHTRFNEIISFVKSGLRDLSVSRTTCAWGIPVPGNPKHTMYVWLDALTNYLSAIGYPDSSFKHYWPADAHVVGKDITKFHAIYWPAFLMAAGIELPKQIVSHGWWMVNGEKMSKSVGNVVEPNAFIEKYGLDQVRYYLLREMSFGNDGNITDESLVSRINAELANKLGNLIQRSLSMAHKNCQAQMPSFTNQEIEAFYADSSILSSAEGLYTRVKQHFDAYEFHRVLDVIFEFIDEVNAYFSSRAPWLLAKTDVRAMEEVLFITLEAARYPVTLLLPFIPDSASKILSMLGIHNASFSTLNRQHHIAPGYKLGDVAPVFPRLPPDIIYCLP